MIFRQIRYGKDRKLFLMYKFRTMAGGRVTRVGRVLRKTHLDELPQILNILRGEMAIVGPRPEMPFLHWEIAVSVEGFDKRLAVKPGLTGLAQVISGLAGVRADDAIKLHWDLWYIRHKSFWLDLAIVVLTAFALLKCSGE